MSTLKNTLSFIRAASMAATIQGHSSKAEFLADRITQSATAITLLAMAERLTKLLGTDSGSMHPATVSQFIASVQLDDARHVLDWLRQYPKLAAMICFLPNAEFETAINDVGDVVQQFAEDVAATRPAFEFCVTATLLAPLAHGSDVKAGNATLFRRQMVRGVDGGVMQLPFFSGNALRGTLRDILADELTRLLGLPVDRATPPYALWFFHALYAGGALEENSAATKAAAKRTGDNGSIRAEGLREFRDLLPSISVLGCAIGNKIISGRLRVADLRPRCKEWGTGESKAESLFDWLYLTRRDDHEGRADGDNKSMIANCEVLKPGVVLDGGIDATGHESELERAALIHALNVFSARGYIGAESRRGFGKCVVELTLPECSVKWAAWVTENKATILAYLETIAALKPEA